MIKFEFQYDNKELVTVNNLSSLFKKEIWSLLEEAVTQNLKHKILHDLEPLRDEMENANIKIVYNYNKVKEEFETQYFVTDDLYEKMEPMLRKK